MSLHSPRIALVGDRSANVRAHTRIPVIVDALLSREGIALDPYWIATPDVSECDPTDSDEREKVATPPERVPLPRSVGPS